MEDKMQQNSLKEVLSGMDDYWLRDARPNWGGGQIKKEKGGGVNA